VAWPNKERILWRENQKRKKIIAAINKCLFLADKPERMSPEASRKKAKKTEKWGKMAIYIDSDQTIRKARGTGTCFSIF
jgi:type IV secretory pathway VirB9-like protein